MDLNWPKGAACAEATDRYCCVPNWRARGNHRLVDFSNETNCFCGTDTTTCHLPAIRYRTFDAIESVESETHVSMGGIRWVRDIGGNRSLDEVYRTRFCTDGTSMLLGVSIYWQSPIIRNWYRGPCKSLHFISLDFLSINFHCYILRVFFVFIISFFFAFQQKCVKARALYDNIAEAPDELAFRKGDVLTVLEQNTAGLEGWWLCALRGRQVVILKDIKFTSTDFSQTELSKALYKMTSYIVGNYCINSNSSSCISNEIICSKIINFIYTLKILDSSVLLLSTYFILWLACKYRKM